MEHHKQSLYELDQHVCQSVCLSIIVNYFESLFKPLEAYNFNFSRQEHNTSNWDVSMLVTMGF